MPDRPKTLALQQLQEQARDLQADLAIGLTDGATAEHVREMDKKFEALATEFQQEIENWQRLALTAASLLQPEAHGQEITRALTKAVADAIPVRATTDLRPFSISEMQSLDDTWSYWIDND